MVLKDQFRDQKNIKIRKRHIQARKKETREKIHLFATEKILYVSPTKSGKIHDFKQLKKTVVIDHIPPDVSILVDKGYTGIKDISEHTSFIPKRKPKNGVLSIEEQENNSMISSFRIKVEHAIGGVKNSGVATNIFRGRFGSDDRFIYISAALWNFKLQYAA